ncbi:Tudor domain [Trinorchestia longiramus]|nr:Tudor domain [Trinorchestia longiramus]
MERSHWRFTIRLQSQKKDSKRLSMFLKSYTVVVRCPISELTVGACVIVKRPSDRRLHRAIVRNILLKCFYSHSVDSIQESLCETPVAPLVYPPYPGMPCLATYEKEYYRARIISCDARAETVQVYFVDYGNTETHPVASLRALPSSLLRPAAQACVAAVAVPTSPSVAATERTNAKAVLQLVEGIEENAVEIRIPGGHRSYMGKSVPVVQLLRPVPETVAPLRDQLEEASLPAAELSPDAVATAELHSG